MSHDYPLAAILPSLNEKERQVLFERFGSIRKIVDSDLKKVGETIGPDRIDVVAADLENYRLGLNKDLHPPIVPIRYDDPNGEARDLRPIRAINWLRENT